MSSFTLVVYDTIMKLQFYHRFCSVLFTSLSPESKKMTYKSYSVNICLMYSIEKRQIPLFMLSLQWQPTLALLPGKSMDGGVWWAVVHGVAKSQTRQQCHFHFSLSCIGEGNGNPLQCSCLENPRDGRAWGGCHL